MNEMIIRARNVCFQYDDAEFAAVKNVSLDVRRGEFLAVLGRNGSGKSTFAKMLNALLMPTSGTVEVDGRCAASEEDCFAVREVCGMVFQNPDNQIVATVVEEDVAFGPENLGLPPEEIRKRVDFALESVDMTEFAHHSPANLSGGQKQRISIAGIIAMTPDYIVLDEPTAMLDPKGRKEVIETVKALNKTQNITVILITHYMEEAAQAARVIVMDGGVVGVDETPQMAFANVALLKRIGLDVPQVTELMFRLRRNGVKVRHDLLTVDECAQEIIREIKENAD